MPDGPSREADRTHVGLPTGPRARLATAAVALLLLAAGGDHVVDDLEAAAGSVRTRRARLFARPRGLLNAHQLYTDAHNKTKHSIRIQWNARTIICTSKSDGKRYSKDVNERADLASDMVLTS